MTTNEIAEKLNLKKLNDVDGQREITGVYSCDLLSLVMGKAPADCAWLTVMGNLNAVAVATLADIGCIILCHGVPMDEEGLKKAQEEEVAVYQSPLPVFDTAKQIDQILSGLK